MNPFISFPLLLPFYKDGFGISLLAKVDIPLNKKHKETNKKRKL